MKITLYHKVSCIASNDFIEYCKHNKFDLTTYRIEDYKFPQIRYDITESELEKLYNRRFYTQTVIIIDGELFETISSAKNYINKNNY